MMTDKSQAALRALRQILKATEINARALAKQSGLNPSKYILLQTLSEDGPQAPSVLAQHLSVTQATMTVLIDKLEESGLVTRTKLPTDKRRVTVSITKQGEKTIRNAPSLLQGRFEKGFTALGDWEQSFLLSALERVASILNAEDIDAAPVLDVGEIENQPEV